MEHESAFLYGYENSLKVFAHFCYGISKIILWTCSMMNLLQQINNKSRSCHQYHEYSAHTILIYSEIITPAVSVGLIMLITRIHINKNADAVLQNVWYKGTVYFEYLVTWGLFLNMVQIHHFRGNQPYTEYRHTCVLQNYFQTLCWQKVILNAIYLKIQLVRKMWIKHRMNCRKWRRGSMMLWRQSQRYCHDLSTKLL